LLTLVSVKEGKGAGSIIGSLEFKNQLATNCQYDPSTNTTWVVARDLTTKVNSIWNCSLTDSGTLSAVKTVTLPPKMITDLGNVRPGSAHPHLVTHVALSNAAGVIGTIDPVPGIAHTTVDSARSGQWAACITHNPLATIATRVAWARMAPAGRSALCPNTGIMFLTVRADESPKGINMTRVSIKDKKEVVSNVPLQDAVEIMHWDSANKVEGSKAVGSQVSRKPRAAACAAAVCVMVIVMHVCVDVCVADDAR
jgi:hypothetical protein